MRGCCLSWLQPRHFHKSVMNVHTHTHTHTYTHTHPAGAIQVLLISDSLFRINHVEKRRKFAELVEGVREAGGEALVRRGGS